MQTHTTPASDTKWVFTNHLPNSIHAHSTSTKRNPTRLFLLHARLPSRLLAGDDATLRQQHVDPPQLSVAVPPPAPLSAPPVGPSWTAVAVVFGLTLTSLAALATTAVLYLKPLLQTMQRATEKSEKAAEEMEKAAKEMEKTALMFQEDIPLTMRDIQRASEEWELVGKQFNFLVGTVSRPLKPVQKPVEAASLAAQAVGRAAQAVGAQAGTTTSTLSKRVVADTSAMANALWGTVNQFRQQLGLAGINGKDAAEVAKKVVNVGRKQQEARAWIERWRGRSGQTSTASSSSNGTVGANKYSSATTLNKDRAVLVKRRHGGSLEEDEVPEGQRYAVEAVVAALARAQRAAEEAALSSSALEAALERAESAGALSSSDEEDDDWIQLPEVNATEVEMEKGL